MYEQVLISDYLKSHTHSVDGLDDGCTSLAMGAQVQLTQKITFYGFSAQFCSSFLWLYIHGSTILMPDHLQSQTHIYVLKVNANKYIQGCIILTFLESAHKLLISTLMYHPKLYLQCWAI